MRVRVHLKVRLGALFFYFSNNAWILTTRRNDVGRCASRLHHYCHEACTDPMMNYAGPISWPCTIAEFHMIRYNRDSYTQGQWIFGGNFLETMTCFFVLVVRLGCLSDADPVSLGKSLSSTTPSSSRLLFRVIGQCLIWQLILTSDGTWLLSKAIS